jgi:Subunit 11 of the general transcription factor TFIIH
MAVQFLIRIVGDLNEQLLGFPPPDDPRGIFYILKEIDEAIVHYMRSGSEGMSQTERIRLRNELLRGRIMIVELFDEYKGDYKIEDAIGKVYERSLEEMEEPFSIDTMVGGFDTDEFEHAERLQQDVMDDIDVG